MGKVSERGTCPCSPPLFLEDLLLLNIIPTTLTHSTHPQSHMADPNDTKKRAQAIVDALGIKIASRLPPAPAPPPPPPLAAAAVPPGGGTGPDGVQPRLPDSVLARAQSVIASLKQQGVGIGREAAAEAVEAGKVVLAEDGPGFRHRARHRGGSLIDQVGGWVGGWVWGGAGL